MRKYRIKITTYADGGECIIAQYKSFLFWHCFTDDYGSVIISPTKQAAERQIEEDKKRILSNVVKEIRFEDYPGVEEDSKVKEPIQLSSNEMVLM